MGRWTDLAEWVGPTINEGDGDGRPNEPADRASECRGVILHIADGYYLGTIAWQKNPDSDVSSQFVVAGPRDSRWSIPDGKLGQVVDTDIIAWTQRSGNGHWISIECSGFSGDALSPAQIEGCAQILARAHAVYGVPLQLATSPSGRGLGHHSMGAESGVDWGHSQCPGPAIKNQKPAILARAQQIVSGVPTIPPAVLAHDQGDDDMLPIMAWCEGGLYERSVDGQWSWHANENGPKKLYEAAGRAWSSVANLTRAEFDALKRPLPAPGGAVDTAAVAAAAKAGAEAGVDEALDGAKVTTTIDTTP